MSTVTSHPAAPATRRPARSPRARRAPGRGAAGICLRSCTMALAVALSSELAHADIRTDALARPGEGREASAGREQPAGAEARFREALAYDLGDGVAQDHERAFALYREAAELGHARAMLNVGLMLSQGHGVPADEAEAVRWMRRAAERGLPDGQYSVGVIYMQGHGVEQDYPQARRWFELAASNGHPEAMNNVGVLHANGLGTPADHVRAYAWFRLAEAAGSQDGQENRIVTERELSPPDVARGTALADDLRANLRRE